MHLVGARLEPLEPRRARPGTCPSCPRCPRPRGRRRRCSSVRSRHGLVDRDALSSRRTCRARAAPTRSTRRSTAGSPPFSSVCRSSGMTLSQSTPIVRPKPRHAAARAERRLVGEEARPRRLERRGAHVGQTRPRVMRRAPPRGAAPSRAHVQARLAVGATPGLLDRLRRGGGRLARESFMRSTTTSTRRAPRERLARPRRSSRSRASPPHEQRAGSPSRASCSRSVEELLGARRRARG